MIAVLRNFSPISIELRLVCRMFSREMAWRLKFHAET